MSLTFKPSLNPMISTSTTRSHSTGGMVRGSRRWAQVKRVIHKAVRPKRDYVNPTRCVAMLPDDVSHTQSVTRWANVTCRACLALRGIRGRK